MRAVWSFWTAPFLAERRSSWASELHHWLAWGLSVAAASIHYPDTELVTDDAGARLLVDRLDLPFAHVSTALNALRTEDPGWWALGKLHAYRLQRAPFVHIDTDVFLWNRLRPDLEIASVIAQNPEPIDFANCCYRPLDFELALGKNGWLPREWLWYRLAAPLHARAECCGIFGGNDLDFIQHYAATAIQLIRDRRNRPAWRQFVDKEPNMILIEQYLLTAMLEYHNYHPGSCGERIDICYVFDSMAEAFRREAATKAGFTHLAADAKRDPHIARDLEERVAQDLPNHFARCMDMASTPLAATG